MPAPAAGLGVAALAVWTAWRPVETYAITPVVLAMVVVLAVPRRWRPADRGLLAGLAAVAAWLGLSAISGPDLATGLRQIALLAAAVAVAWLASTRPSSAQARLLLASGLAALSLWALWQHLVGFDLAAGAVAELAADVRPVAASRLASGRGFASLLVPGHLAVLLVMALGLLLPHLERRAWGRPVAGLAVGLAAIGLVVTRSPIGLGLAGLGGAGYAVATRRRALAAGLMVTAVLGIAWVAAERPDVLELEPARLRLENWRTAAWMIGSAPVTGVGFGGYGLASAAVPFEVGNRPAHAHCMPLELAAELGVAGWALVLLGGAWLATRIGQSWRSAPGIALALGAVALHNLVDFSAYTSGVLIPTAVLLGWAASPSRRPATTEAGVARVVAVTTAAVATALAILHGTSVMLERSALAAPMPARLELALRAARLAPWAAAPVATAAAIAVESGSRVDCRAVLELLDRRHPLRRGSANLASLESRLRIKDQDPLGAVAAAWQACALRTPGGSGCDDLADLIALLEGQPGALAD